MTTAATYPAPMRAAVEDSYHGVKRWITSVSSEFQKRYGGDVEEMIQEASLAFLHALRSWNPDRASFTYYLRMRIWDRLFHRYIRQPVRDAARLRRVDPPCPAYNDAQPSMDSYQAPSSFDSRHFLAMLGEDARSLAQACLDGARTADDLWEYAAGAGWCLRRFDRAFDEVKEVLS